ncbi:MAG: nuclease [Acidobacteria bacterium]|nr:nuclease [Acidobacteriota bacterium]
MTKTLFRMAALAASMSLCHAWGVRGHREINRAAVRGIADDGPAFLKAHEDYIVFLGPVPDNWRVGAEPFVKIFEDPNHGWFQEQSPKLMQNPPRSRYEFVIELYREYEKTKNPRTNVRWTGTMPYAAVEMYERIQAGMRRYRAAKELGSPELKFIELEIATSAGYLGHYLADSANPMHNTIHHDGWEGENPKGYSTDPRVHGRFETAFVELIQLTSKEVSERMPVPKVLDDPFNAMMAHIGSSFAELEHAYALDKAGAFTDENHEEGRALVYKQTAAAASLMRDMLHTAWVRSKEPLRMGGANDGRNRLNPISPSHPQYNPATGSAPAAKRD